MQSCSPYMRASNLYNNDVCVHVLTHLMSSSIITIATRTEMRVTLRDKRLSVLLIISSGMIIVYSILTHGKHQYSLYNRNLLVNSRIASFKAKGKDIHHLYANLSYIPHVLHVGSSYNKYNSVILRTAYANGMHIIILTEVSQIVLEQDLIMSCQINGQFSSYLEVVPDRLMNWIQTHKKGYTHFFAIIYCFGFQSELIQSNKRVNVIYRTVKNGSNLSVDTEYVLEKLQTPKANSIVVCATMYGHPARFDEWLRYQKAIGVDMVHVSAQLSFLLMMEQYPFLTESLNNKFVKVQVWKEYLKENEIFYHSQSLVYQDCVMQYRHSFEYAMMIDYDDFFIPLVSQQVNIHYYLNLFFSANIASVGLPWIQYHCKPLNYTFLDDGNITRILSGNDQRKRLESKSIHRLDAVEIVSIHKAYKVKSGFTIDKIRDVNVAYFAHIRPSMKWCKTHLF